jgi:EAL domain-containing protein (putative c-di-GMP-specific phosphodiesterase class I)
VFEEATMTGALSKQAEEESEALPVAALGIQQALKAVRSHLGMDVALVSEFVGDKLYFRHVAAKRRSPVRPGDCMPLEHCYCPKIAEGKLPELIPDTGAIAEATAIAVTHTIPIGAYIGTPLRLADGRLYGAFSCFSFRPDPSLDERDLDLMRAFAGLVAAYIDAELDSGRRRHDKIERIEGILKSNEPSMVFQPMFRLSDMSIAGAEALSRFRSEPVRAPDVWFAEAGEVGLKTELELKSMRKALAEFQPVWKRSPIQLDLNSSPQTIIDGSLMRVLAGVPAERITIEITEHDHVEDYEELRRALEPLRLAGIRIAIDDAGSGYASMRHILNIAPDFIKLDISLTRAIDRDDMRRALAAALIAFGRQTKCCIIAEGVETDAELATLRELGVHSAQGYRLGRPVAIDSLRRLLREERSPGAGPSGVTPRARS